MRTESTARGFFKASALRSVQTKDYKRDKKYHKREAAEFD